MNAQQDRVRQMTTAEQYEEMVADTPYLDPTLFHLDIQNAEVLAAHVNYLARQGLTITLRDCLSYIVTKREIYLLACFVGHVDFNEFFTIRGDLLEHFVNEGIMDVLTFLLNNGLSPNHTGSRGVTMLSSALYFRKRDVVNLLLERGADVNKPDLGGMTPVIKAVWKCEVEFLDCLITQGVDLTVTYGVSSQVWDVGHHACVRGDSDIIKRLIDMRFPFRGTSYICLYIQYFYVRDIRFSKCRKTLEALLAAGAEKPSLSSVNIPNYYDDREELEDFLRAD